MRRCAVSARWAAAFLGLGFAATLALAQPPAQAALRQVVAEAGSSGFGESASPAEREGLAKLYDDGGRLLWSDGVRPTPAAQALVGELQRAAARGLDPEDYAGERLATMLARLADASPAAEDQWAIFDVTLSLAGMRLMSDLHYGRIDPASVGHNLSVERVKLDIPATLARLAGSGDASGSLDSLEPQFTHYRLLEQQLAHYRELAADPRLTVLPPLTAKSLKPGDAYAGAPLLERLLTALGDDTLAPQAAANAAAPATLTPSLDDALKRFQSRHGEKADGVLGAATMTELTRPLTERVRQIELTMERWRWLPAEWASAPIIVNIPQFRLFAFESTADSEARIRQMDVIVGKAFEGKETPVFAADMTYLIFRPYWEVPYSIALKEVVPAARANPDSLEKHRMELVRGAGDGATVMPNTRENVELLAKGILRVRQKPGPDNSLGLVKFMFPNPYNVYLHSTPARALFGESRRDFSHGCVRVSDPVGLAQYVLRDSPEWTRERIQDAMNGESTLTVKLNSPIRVFMVYGTALALEDGRMLFFDDIYGHDRRLEAALSSRRAAKPSG